MIVDRTTEILGSIDRLQTEWDEWADDPMAPEAIEEDSSLEDAIQVAISTCDNGDVPSRCRELIDAVSRFAMEHEAYRNGEFDPQSRAPWRKHSAAYAAIVRARIGSDQPQRTVVESVKSLREQKDSSGRPVSFKQIAIIYAARINGKYVGPFFGPNEEVLNALIEQEAATPGSVIKSDFVHPQDIVAEKQRETNIAGRLNRLQRKDDEDKPRRHTDADVLAYLKEGAFANQAARLYRLPLSEIHRIARDGGLNLPGANDHLMATPVTSETGHEDREQKRIEQNSDAEVTAAILKMSGDGIGIPEIRKAIAKQFRNNINIESVAAIVRNSGKSASASATETPSATDVTAKSPTMAS